ncbi:SAM-dependent chlorinase/fluorinase [candidate division WOR-3 bacterium]|nr:SAM-dependent chlorinase/fluorinase [candidate division WOR-3 bacterium]
MVITLLTDFGLDDSYVGVMKGVIATINPSAVCIDITHSIPQGDIKKAAFCLFTAYKYFPKGTIHLVVVDPGVGTKRNPIIVETSDYYFVGPDNGIFSFIYEKERFKVYKIVGTISNPALIHKCGAGRAISNTFHGRDIFAPVAAKLSLGIKPSKIGKPLNNWVSFKPPKPEMVGKELVGEVLDIDKFGNLITNIPKSLFESRIFLPFEIKIRNCIINEIKTSYQSSLGGPIAIFGSSGFLEISLPNSNCAKALNAKRGTKIFIKPPRT